MRPMKQAIYSSRTADKFVVRLPDGMREKIAERARTHHRSMNSEIVAVLERDLLEPTEGDRAVEHELHTNPDAVTPLQVGMVAWYDYKNDGKLALGQIQAIAISLDDKVHVTFDLPLGRKNLPSLILGGHGDDPRVWLPIDRVQPYLI